MIKKRLIVCIASAWDYDPTSKHHIMKILSAENEILWINYHGTRRPSVSAIDIKDTYAALRRVAHGMRRISPSMVQLTPLVIPGATHSGLEKLHRRMVVAQIRRAAALVNGEKNLPIQIWSFAPDVPFLIGALNEEQFVYYCVDEYRQFEGFDPQRMAQAENEMLDNADLVITSSVALLHAKRTRRADTVLVRHGVDFDHFASAWQSSLETPADIRQIPKPIFGYFGLLHHWVDCELLAEVARQRPQYSFVLIGESKVDTSALEGLSNVHLIGRRPYDQLPAYAASFSAGMLLFANNAMTPHVNPVKMYEYLAAGLPVLSTPLPEAERFRGAITIAADADRFAEACDDIASNPPPNREKISRIVRNETWNAKVEYLSDMICGQENPVLQTASKPISDVDPRETARADAFPISGSAI